MGNPNLNPEYTNSFETGYLFETEAISFLSTVYYRHRTDVIQRFSTIDSITGITQNFPINLATQNAYGIELNFSYELKKWLRFNSSFNFYKAITDGAYKEKSLHSETYSWTNRTSLTLYLGDWDMQTSFNYRGPRNTTQGKELATYFIDLGLTRDVFKDKGTLAFSVRDLLNSRKRRSIIDSEGLYSKTEFQWHSRQFLLTFTYRLNQESNGDGDDEREENGNDTEF
jgi:outer membrane receptor protein involved in Fe transport